MRLNQRNHEAKKEANVSFINSIRVPACILLIKRDFHWSYQMRGRIIRGVVLGGALSYYSFKISIEGGHSKRGSTLFGDGKV